MELSVYSLLFLLMSILTFMVSGVAFSRRRVVGATELGWLMFSVAFWTYFVFFESMAKTVEFKILWSKISYLGVTTTPVLYFLFVLRLTRQYRLKDHRLGGLLFLLPLVTVVLAATNEWHHLVWTSFGNIDPSSNIMAYEHGIWFYVGYVLYSYVLIGISTILLVDLIRKREKVYRRQGLLVLMAGLIPILASFIYLSGYKPFNGADITPLSMALSGFLFTVAIFRTKLIHLIPVARQLLVETMPIGIVILDDERCIQEVNPVAARMLQIDEVVLGTPLASLGSSALLRAMIDLNLKRKEEMTVQSEQGRTLRLLRQREPRLKGNCMFTIYDVTEALRQQQELEHARNRFESLNSLFRLMSDNLTNMLWARDLDGRYLFANKALCSSVLGVDSSDDVVGKTMHDLMQLSVSMSELDTRRLRIAEISNQTDAIVLQTGKPGVFDEVFWRDGEEVHLSVHKAPLLDDRGQIMGIVGTASDVTEQKNTERELFLAKQRAEESDRLKTAFLANMSHEIRTPMNGIMGFISLLQSNQLSADEKQEYLNIVEQSGRELLATINDILELSKVQSGDLSVQLRPFNVNELLTAVYTMCKSEADLKGLAFDMPQELPLEQAYIRSDREKIHSICLQFVRMAIKRSQKGCVRFSSSIDGRRLTLKFLDSNASLPATGIDGLGLGMALAKAYVDVLGGNIQIENEVNLGCHFYVHVLVDPIDVSEDAADLLRQ
ncbi:MAG: histidine kinase N-terminal 7TM domain-containing protein [Bacteroidales bacterium]|nr:histidine kinase N-terminal 7TM domain-containing protein [Bacteroidales bacterium]